MSHLGRLWRERLEALTNQIDKRQQSFATIKGAQMGTAGEVESASHRDDIGLTDYARNKIEFVSLLLLRLNAFANTYANTLIAEFENGVQPTGDEDKKLREQFPPEHVLGTVFHQIGYDLDVLSMIASDHFSSAGQKTLQQADFLAKKALEPAVQAKLLGEMPIVLSYFQKSPSIRIIPYANVCMLGIPYTAQQLPQDLLAIPHEVGHYVYWQGKLAKKLHDDPPRSGLWCFKWMEETFADVYGTFIAGPFIALSFQELQLQSSEEHFTLDDGDHPTPILRPFIYAKALHKYWSAWAPLFKAHWKSRLATRQGHMAAEEREKIKLHTGHRRRIYSEVIKEKLELEDVPNNKEANKQLPADNIIVRIVRACSKLESTDHGGNWWYELCAASLPDAGEGQPAVANLYNKLAEKTATLNKAPQDFPAPKGEEVEALIEGWTKSGLPGSPDWFNVWRAGGWTTEGPQCEGSSGLC